PHYSRTGDTDSLDVAVRSLKAMISGGIYDHVGGGFARYSVDERWDIPHFEKMLYDQALIGSALLHAWKLTGDPDIEMALQETIAYVLRDLTNDEGGFCSAEDADADGVEGSFTVFTPREIEEILGEDAREFCEWFNITSAGNFEGRSNPRRPPHGTIVRSPKMESLWEKVFTAREQRVRPGLDDKVLLEWNGLMLSTLAEAAAAFQNPAWMDAAKRNAAFLLNNLRAKGRWHRAWAQGHAQHTPVSADLAALTDAFTRLYEASGEPVWLAEAVTAADLLIKEYADLVDGGSFTTANDAERLIARNKDLMDNATPGANSLGAVALIRLSPLANRSDFREEAIAAIRLVAESIEQHPTAFGHMLQALALAHEPPIELVITGDRADLVEVAQSGFYPDVVLSWGERISDSALWEHKDDGLAFACRDYVCKAPVSTANELADLLA
ncbi:MAG: thioredoxin domain-containing protein, partial [Acidimicrobiales bacterium]